MEYRRYKVQVKEVGKVKKILTPEVWGYVTEEDVIRKLGLRNPDVEWYIIEQIKLKEEDYENIPKL